MPDTVVNSKIKCIESLISMVHVEGGTFMMGAKSENVDYKNELPAHMVTVDSYFISKYLITQELYEMVMGVNPSFCVGATLPVEQVSWYDAVEFCKKLSQLTGKNYLLPTEAQWEFAAIGGNGSKGYLYCGSDHIGDVAWFGQAHGNTYDDGNSGEHPHPVGTKAPNELGIYDMSGNVWEWCRDWYSDYSEASLINPAGSSDGNTKIMRGGSWASSARSCRVTNRLEYDPSKHNNKRGFRIVLEYNKSNKL